MTNASCEDEKRRERRFTSFYIENWWEPHNVHRPSSSRGQLSSRVYSWGNCVCRYLVLPRGSLSKRDTLGGRITKPTHRHGKTSERRWPIARECPASRCPRCRCCSECCTASWAIPGHGWIPAAWVSCWGPGRWAGWPLYRRSPACASWCDSTTTTMTTIRSCSSRCVGELLC